MDSHDPFSLLCGFARKGEMFRATYPETDLNSQSRCKTSKRLTSRGVNVFDGVWARRGLAAWVAGLLAVYDRAVLNDDALGEVAVAELASAPEFLTRVNSSSDHSHTHLFAGRGSCAPFELRRGCCPCIRFVHGSLWEQHRQRSTRPGCRCCRCRQRR